MLKVVADMSYAPGLDIGCTMTKQTKAINFRALGPKNKLKNLESKVTTSIIRRDMCKNGVF